MKFASPKFALRPSSLNQAKRTKNVGARHLAREKQRRKELRFLSPDPNRIWPENFEPLERAARWAASRVTWVNSDFEERYLEARWRLYCDYRKIAEAPNPDALAYRIALYHLLSIRTREQRAPQIALSQLTPELEERSIEGEISLLTSRNSFQEWWRAESTQKCFKAVHASLDVLSPNERAVIRGYFGFDGEIKSVEQLGSELLLSNGRVMHLKGEALLKLGTFLRKSGFGT